MKITIEQGDTKISVEKKDMDIRDIFDGFIFCLYGMHYEIHDIEDLILKTAEEIKENHKQ